MDTTHTASYYQGFVHGCKVAGITPEDLLKYAQMQVTEKDTLPSDQNPNRKDNPDMGFNVKNWAAELGNKSTGRLPKRSNGIVMKSRIKIK